MDLARSMFCQSQGSLQAALFRCFPASVLKEISPKGELQWWQTHPQPFPLANSQTPSFSCFKPQGTKRRAPDNIADLATSESAGTDQASLDTGRGRGAPPGPPAPPSCISSQTSPPDTGPGCRCSPAYCMNHTQMAS